LCADYNKSGSLLLTAGTSRKIYAFDESSEKVLKFSMYGKDLKVPGHQNRIFCVKSHPLDENLLVTSGWDSSIKIYDLRKRYPIASIGGPLCSGDSIDIYDDMILAGSNRNNK
jgi:WD40 repeat protein